MGVERSEKTLRWSVFETVTEDFCKALQQIDWECFAKNKSDSPRRLRRDLHQKKRTASAVLFFWWRYIMGVERSEKMLRWSVFETVTEDFCKALQQIDWECFAKIKSDSPPRLRGYLHQNKQIRTVSLRRNCSDLFFTLRVASRQAQPSGVMGPSVKGRKGPRGLSLLRIWEQRKRVSLRKLANM